MGPYISPLGLYYISHERKRSTEPTLKKEALAGTHEKGALNPETLNPTPLNPYAHPEVAMTGLQPEAEEQPGRLGVVCEPELLGPGCCRDCKASGL